MKRVGGLGAVRSYLDEDRLVPEVCVSLYAYLQLAVWCCDAKLVPVNVSQRKQVCYCVVCECFACVTGVTTSVCVNRNQWFELVYIFFMPSFKQGASVHIFNTCDRL